MTRPPGPPDRDLVLGASAAGVGLVRAWTEAVDQWVGGLFARAVGGVGDATGLALVAVGGYGRAQLCPGSDLDLLLLHDRRDDIAEVAESLWYPIWDEGLKLGHAVRTPKEALSLAGDDLDTATSLLDVRLLAGDGQIAARLAADAASQWEKRGRRWLARLADSVDTRHAQAGEVAFLLEPDLKSGRGGLRDIHAVRWAERARQVLFEGDHSTLDAAELELLGARAELHRVTGRAGDILTLEDQGAVAEAIGDADADALMVRVAAAARTVAWRSDETWMRVRARLAGPGWSVGGRVKAVAPGVEMRDREIHVTAAVDVAADPAVALRAAAAAARNGTRIERASLERLAAEVPPFGTTWPDGAREALVDLLRAGRPAVGVIEALDQVGVWLRVIPEWETARNRPQRNAYHRFTVDRHLCEAAANAAALVDDVDRPDLLVLGALFHDIGKGRPGDHTQVGIDLVGAIAPRMGLPPEDVAVLQDMVRHHLLLPDVATRRDLDDPATAAGVAERVGSVGTLRLLGALTVADALATGPAAWGPWKAGLVATLVARTAVELGAPFAGGPATGVPAPPFPSAEHRALLAGREVYVSGSDEVLTVTAPDRPGLLGRVAGVVALHRLGVLAVDAVSDDHGWAVERIQVSVPPDDVVNWPRVAADVEAALAGRLAVRARLADRARSARGFGPPRTASGPRAEVRFDDDASARATVIEVHAADAVGLLERVCRAMAEMDLDIRSAKVQTLGDRVVDAFYVRTASGEKISDDEHQAEIRRAVLHALDSG